MADDDVASVTDAEDATPRTGKAAGSSRAGTNPRRSRAQEADIAVSS